MRHCTFQLAFIDYLLFFILPKTTYTLNYLYYLNSAPRGKKKKKREKRKSALFHLHSCIRFAQFTDEVIYFSHAKMSYAL